MCFLVGCMYCPKVTTSTSEARRSASENEILTESAAERLSACENKGREGEGRRNSPTRAFSTCSSVSPTPSMMEVFVMTPARLACRQPHTPARTSRSTFSDCAKFAR
jgi:hypothetical protein